MIARLDSIVQAAHWLRQRVPGRSLHTDSRLVKPGDGFIAWPGAATDGRQHVSAALHSGAQACLVEAEGGEVFAFDGPEIAEFRGLKAASGPIAAEYFDHPSRDVTVLAVTGTNGKTSTTWWLAQALCALKDHQHGSLNTCGLMGTFGVGVPGSMRSTGLTTADPVMMQHELARMRDEGFGFCAIEASSIGIEEHRLAGLRVDVAVFTNFTQDHLDYHHTMQAYWLAKRKLFEHPGLRAAVINLDDPKAQELVRHCESRSLKIVTVSTQSAKADLRVRSMKQEAGRMTLQFEAGSQICSFSCPLVGHYNACNLLCAAGVLLALDYSLATACEALSGVTPVPGRLEVISHGQGPLVVVDYAHTPDALSQALGALANVAAQRGGQLWCVFGCGGNRDQAKRPLMGAVAQRGADHVVVTSDNPRHEDPQDIISHIVSGLDSSALDTVRVEVDRQRAIQTAIKEASGSDIVLLAGKGHEDHQEIRGVRYAFKDQDHALRALEMRSSGAKP